MSHIANPVSDAGELRNGVLSPRGTWKDIQLSGYELWELVRSGRTRETDEAYFRDNGAFSELVRDIVIREKKRIRYISHAHSDSEREGVYDVMPNGLIIPDGTGSLFIHGTLIPSKILEYSTPEEKVATTAVATALLADAGIDPDTLPYFFMTEIADPKRKLSVLRCYNPEHTGKFDVNILYTTLRVPEFVYRARP